MSMLLTEEYLAWGIRKEDTKLLNQANDYLKQLKSDGSLNRMIEKWIPLE
jgi:ABC-type amino acid transport substrate-binding protein